MATYMGVDPGASGAIVVMNELAQNIDFIKNKETEHDLAAFVRVYAPQCKAVLERVNAMPKQGVSSTFKFGSSFGFLRGLLVSHAIPFELVTPAKWQGDMKCRSKGDKNVTKAAAQRLFPDIKITHANADALLLAEYGRRTVWN